MEQQSHKTIWKVIELEIQQAFAILSIDEKLGKHINEIQSVSIHCISSNIETDVPECGELSVSINNRKEHILHTTTSYTNDLARDMGNTLSINAKLNKNSILTVWSIKYQLFVELG